jgi:hypothetical protein
MLTVINYVTAFWSMVIVPCVTVPSNWEQCSKIDKWLFPELVHAWELKTKKVVPYQTEKEYLRGIASETSRKYK